MWLLSFPHHSCQKRPSKSLVFDSWFERLFQRLWCGKHNTHISSSQYSLITIQTNLGSSRHYHPRIFITTQTIWGVVDITIQEFSLPSKIIFWWFKSVENEQDFEFLAGMLLLRKVNGSSSFYKGPRTCKVWKSADPSGPWTFAKTTTPINFSQ